MGYNKKSTKVEKLTEYKSPYPFLPPALGQPSPPANVNFNALLEALAHVKIIKERQYFLGQHINLDGQKFIECRFDQCTLITETGDIFLQNCVFGDGNTAIFGQNTKKVVQLAFMLDPKQVPPGLLAQVKQAGLIQTISIT